VADDIQAFRSGRGHDRHRVAIRDGSSQIDHLVADLRGYGHLRQARADAFGHIGCRGLIGHIEI
jgi:hypothetical protein